MSSHFEPVMGIYALAHPDSGRVMYVGQSVDIDHRYRRHCDYLPDSSVRKQTWISDLLAEGRRPQLIVLERVQNHFGLDNAERKWIRKYKSSGEAELNAAVGGKSRAKSSTLNSHRDEWFQFAHDARAMRASLRELANASVRMISAKHCDAILKLEQKLGIVVSRIADEVAGQFPEWTDVYQTLNDGPGLNGKDAEL